MKKFIIIGIMTMIMAMILAGCSISNMPAPIVEGNDITQENSRFTDYATNMECTTFNVFNTTTFACPSNTSIGAISHNDITKNWSISCCKFDPNKCYLEAVGNPNELCTNNTKALAYDTFYNATTNLWRARCCDAQGSNCFMDYDIDVFNASTVCDKTYNNFIMDSNYTSPLWWGLCCRGGYQ